MKNDTTFLHARARGAAAARSASRFTFKRLVLAAVLALGAATATSRAGIPEPDFVWYGKVFATLDNSTVRLTSGTLAWRLDPVSGGPAMVFATQLTNINDQFSFLLRVPCETPEPGQLPATNVVNLTSPASRYRRLTVMLDGQPLTLLNGTNEFTPLITDRGRAERMDLRLGAPPVDSDGDGLADAWELQHFGNLNQNGSGDFDGDGVSDLREFRAGTNPADPNSRFEVVELTKVPNGMLIRWTSQSGRSYRVKRTDSLLTPAANYTLLQSGLAATPPMNQFIDTNPNASAQAFYLIEIAE